MEMRWNLNNLYTGYDSVQYEKDLEVLDKLIDDFLLWSNSGFEEDSQEVLRKYIELTSKSSKLTSKMAIYSMLRLSVDSNDEEARSNSDMLDPRFIKLAEAHVRFKTYIKSLDKLEEVIGDDPLLKEHSFYLRRIKEASEHSLSEEEEILYSKLKISGSNAWSDLHGQLTSNLKVNINLNGIDKKLTLAQVRNLAFDKDPYVRKTAYFAELNSYKQIDTPAASALNSIKSEVINISKAKGYSSPLEETLDDSRMTEETLNSLIESIKYSLEDFRKYFQRKAQILNHKNGLPFYDLFAPLGNSSRTFSFEEAREYIVKNFRTFSDKLANYADQAFRENWIDAEPRPGKRGGAFCSNIHPIGESRIMANFSGSFSSVITLAHELGHGYHGYILKDASILNSRYPMPIAETASIFCETIVKNAALKEADPEEAILLLESSISDAAQVIVDIYSRFLFEKQVFLRRESGNLSVDELNRIMLEAQKESYGSGLDPDFLHQYMWINKGHYYSASRSYYNFPYAFGLLFSLGLYSHYLKSPEDFLEKYDDLLMATGSNTIEDVAMMMDIDTKNPDFFKSSIEIIKKDIDKFLELTEDLVK